MHVYCTPTGTCIGLCKHTQRLPSTTYTITRLALASVLRPFGTFAEIHSNTLAH